VKRRYIITALIGLAIALAVTALRGGFTSEVSEQVFSAVCDGCFAAGALLGCVGLLVFVADDGFFDLMNYGVQRALRLVLSQKRQSGFPRTYYEYHQLKRGTRKGSPSFILVVGLCWLALAVLCLVLCPSLLP